MDSLSKAIAFQTYSLTILVTKATFYVNLPYYTFEREGAIVTRPDQQIGAH